MIEDWRDKFFAASEGQSDRKFPFGFVQVGLSTTLSHSIVAQKAESVICIVIVVSNHMDLATICNQMVSMSTSLLHNLKLLHVKCLLFYTI